MIFKIYYDMRIETIANRRFLFFVLFIFFLFIFDQLSKQLVISHIPPGNSTPLAGKFIYLTPIKNKGLIMGLLSYSSHLVIFFTIFVLIVFIFLWLMKLKKKGRLAIAFIIAGAGGNLLDRIFKGGVIDFIDLKIWPIFNLADIFITVGAILLFIDLITLRKKCTE